MKRTLVALTLAVSAGACAPALLAPAPQVTPVSPAALPDLTFAQKQTWILRLEDQRVLRDPSALETTIDQRAVVTAPPVPDLLRMLTDEDGRIRRRAALAVGRVGLRDGVPPLIALLADAEPEVRQMAAFALGLIGDARARDPLVAALSEPSPLVKGSAAEALGLIGDASAADAIASMASQIVQSGGIAESAGADADDRRESPSAAFRLALYALARLKAYVPLASVVMDSGGTLRVRSWPVAFALCRLEDPRALQALLALAGEADPYTRTFAVKGLGSLKDRAAVPQILPLVSSSDRSTAVEAIRALGLIGDARAAPALVKLIQAAKPDPFLRLEAVSVLGAVGGDGTFDLLLDLVADPSPAIRAAVLRSLAQLDSQAFVTILSGLDADPTPTVRMALASALGTMPAESALPRLRTMLQEPDQRVVPSVLAALAKLRAPEAASVLMERLKADDAVVRAAAATAIGELKPSGGAAALAQAYRSNDGDATYVARAAALTALAVYGAADATPVLNAALQDRDWAVRVRAAALLKQFDPGSDIAARIRPAPLTLSPADYSMERLVNPPVATQAFIETDRGLIQLELAVLDAPLTVENFVRLARKGFFDGLTVHRVVQDFIVQTGDPRGDGEGGPGYTIRDELNQRAYLRGAVGMALDWANTGGSQFFITHSPQPHLDGKYTVFGHIIAGMDVVDQIQAGDVISRVRIWDGS